MSLVTEKTESGTTSKLLVTRAELNDSGNYSCVPKNAASASVIVHVLNGKTRPVVRFQNYYKYGDTWDINSTWRKRQTYEIKCARVIILWQVVTDMS